MPRVALLVAGTWRSDAVAYGWWLSVDSSQLPAHGSLLGACCQVYALLAVFSPVALSACAKGEQ